MCNSTTSNWYSATSYCSNSTIAEPYLSTCDNTPTEIIPYKRKPHFRWNLKGWFNVKLSFCRYYELGLQKGIRLPFRLLRSKNSWV